MALVTSGAIGLPRQPAPVFHDKNKTDPMIPLASFFAADPRCGPIKRNRATALHTPRPSLHPLDNNNSNSYFLLVGMWQSHVLCMSIVFSLSNAGRFDAMNNFLSGFINFNQAFDFWLILYIIVQMI